MTNRLFWLSGIVCIALSMSGCTSAQWTKAGATQQDFATDSYDCEKDARQSGYYGSGLAGAINMQGFFNRCMNAHGWTLATVPSSGMSITNTAPTYTQEQWVGYRSPVMAHWGSQRPSIPPALCHRPRSQYPTMNVIALCAHFCASAGSAGWSITYNATDATATPLTTRRL